MFENVSLSTVEIIHNYGYAFEIHYVTTEDGYILEMHRIPRSRSGQKPTRNFPVFIHHGILESSADWVLAGPDYSLAMQLADDGYDIWLANCRGNTYSRKNKTLTYKQKEFWDFSLNEIGQYDLPASIDYILTETKISQLHYIGFSMGTTVFYIMASEKPEYQPKIRSQVSLAPIAYLYNTRSMLRNLAPQANILSIMPSLSTGMFMTESRFQKLFASTMAHEIIIKRLVIERSIIFSICGSDPIYFNSDLIPIILGHVPAGTSVKLTQHYAQLIMKNRFGMFDYGSEGNKKYYNAAVPPEYNLKSIKVPITLMYGRNDTLSDTNDVMKLRQQLPKLMDAFPVENPYCNHADFLFSTNVKPVVNDPVKKIMDTTDDINWLYTGPKPFITDDVTASKLSETVQDFVPNMDYFEKILDSIIAKAMPQYVNENDKVEFKQERNKQNTLFHNLIKLVKSGKTEDGELPDDFPGVVSDWMDAMKL